MATERPAPPLPIGRGSDEPFVEKLDTIIDQARYRGWTLLAAHVRTNHIHVVLHANLAPEQVMNIFKAYASRALNQASFDSPQRKRWTRHGSTRYLWREEDVTAAVEYVVREQGEPMEVFEATLEAL